MADIGGDADHRITIREGDHELPLDRGGVATAVRMWLVLDDGEWTPVEYQLSNAPVSVPAGARVTVVSDPTAWAERGGWKLMVVGVDGVEGAGVDGKGAVVLSEPVTYTPGQVARFVTDARAEAFQLGWDRGAEAAGDDVARRRGVAVVLAADELRGMPDGFVTSYGRLWEAGLRGVRSTQRAEDGAVRESVGGVRSRVSTNATATRGGARGSRKSGGSPGWIGNEVALAFKTRIDRKLRQLSRDILGHLDGGESRSQVRRCVTCKRFGEDGWAWCPYDRGQMEMVEP